MFNSITPTSPHFTGKTYSSKRIRDIEECAENIYGYSRKQFKRTRSPFSAYPNGYVTNSNHPRLEKYIWAYRVPDGSKELTLYEGSTKLDAGFSTESGGYGGGWLKADINTPLSTKDVHTCAVINLVNEITGQQFMYHVFDSTSQSSIERLIEEQFPRFTKANILPGDRRETNNTVNNIIDVIDSLNPKVAKEFYHMPVENPEVVAVNGRLQYLNNISPTNMTFRQITDQYNY